MVKAAWPVLTAPAADETFRVFFEFIGLAAARQHPYAELAPPLIEAWIDWLAARLEGDTDRRRREAAATVALVDGLILTRLAVGAETADQVAQSLGLVDSL